MNDLFIHPSEQKKSVHIYTHEIHIRFLIKDD